MALNDLASYIGESPNAHVILLKWCKDLKGVPHEFLLLNVELQSPDRRTLWLRLDRRSHRDTTASQLISSTSASADTHAASHRSSHRIRDPPPLETLRDLLFILMEESPNYKLIPENCIFFCSVIYENLVSLGGGMNIGTPRIFSMSLAPTVRAKIKSRRQTGQGRCEDVQSTKYETYMSLLFLWSIILVSVGPTG
ncbi:hypothetical protein BS47DRAFT_1384022 [Hydnum rufescens UP504]|uniref:Uncharacterized protein n=1 Tax=Hydnum rufescens UP504 TaxID=1448309 RepID=A0A9P6DTA8_9AGAM|nr:hypothetical protein BS47DRAFT_1384022 [Hydnum rufescens UP504]